MERRPFKDTVATLEPIVKYAHSPKGQAMVAQLTQIANSMKRIEQAQQNRVYHPRVLRSEDLSKKDLKNENKAVGIYRQHNERN